MGRNNSNQDTILKRREEVSRYRLRGWTQRQIAEFLCCGLATVNRDIQAIEAEWREAAQATIEQHKQRVLAELAEVKRAAWSDKSYGAVLQAIKAEVDLLGLGAPVKIEHSGEVQLSDSRDRLAQQLDRIAAVSEASNPAQRIN